MSFFSLLQRDLRFFPVVLKDVECMQGSLRSSMQHTYYDIFYLPFPVLSPKIPTSFLSSGKFLSYFVFYETYWKFVCGPGQLSRYSDWLREGRSGDRIPVGARFSVPVQTGPGTHPASCTMGTGSFQGVKRQGTGVDHPPLSSAEVKKTVGLYLYSPSGPLWPVLG